MFEKKFQLDSIDPLDLYGVNNTRLDKLKSFFPKLKIVARGNILKAMGDEDTIFQFEKKRGKAREKMRK